MNLEPLNYAYEDPQANRGLFAKAPGNPPPNGGEGGNPPPNGGREGPAPAEPGNPPPNGGKQPPE